MKILFYRAEYGTFVDKLIAWWTRGPYSHTELYFEEDGLCYSCSPREDECRYKKIDISGEHWDYFFLKDEYFDYEQIRFFCDTQLGKRYDWIGIIFSHIIRWNKHCKNKWFCSEICAEILKIENSNRYSPNKLYKYLIENENKFIKC